MKPQETNRIAKKQWRHTLMSLLLASAALLVLTLQAQEPYPGYTLFSAGKTAYLYNMEKQKVHQWEVADGSVKTSPYLLPDGSVVFPLNKGGWTFRPAGAHASGTFQRISWEGSLLWDFQFFGPDFTPSYDVEPMPNGNILVCAGFQEHRMPGKLFEIKPVGKNGGEVVWECHVTAHLGSNVQGYINSVSYNPILDQIMVNIQTPGRTLAIFDHNTPNGELLFKWDQGFSGRIHGGNWIVDKYRGTTSATAAAHSGKMGVGNLLTVSNDDHEVVEIDPRTNRKVRSIPYQLSKHQGSAQRLPNGNTLIVSGYSTRIDEVTEDGTVVWSLETPDRIARALRYGLDYPGVAKLKQP